MSWAQREGFWGSYSREGCFPLLHVLALGPRAGFATQVDSDAHEQPTLVQEVAGDIHGHQQCHEHHHEDANDGCSAQARGRASAGFRDQGREEEKAFGLKVGVLGLSSAVLKGLLGIPPSVPSLCNYQCSSPQSASEDGSDGAFGIKLGTKLCVLPCTNPAGLLLPSSSSGGRSRVALALPAWPKEQWKQSPGSEQDFFPVEYKSLGDAQCWGAPEGVKLS